MADLVCYSAGSVSGSVALDRKNGETQILTLAGNVTSISVANWGASGTMSKLTLIIENGGAYTVAFPTAKWVSGAAPVVSTTVSGTVYDVFMLVTPDHGTTVFGNIIGQNYH